MAEEERVTCPVCKGDPFVGINGDEANCKRCRGRGTVPVRKLAADGHPEGWVEHKFTLKELQELGFLPTPNKGASGKILFVRKPKGAES